MHAHGGYQTGLIATSEAIFALEPARGDVLLVIATPGWITGQSYMIAAALLMRTPSVRRAAAADGARGTRRGRRAVRQEQSRRAAMNPPIRSAREQTRR